MARPPLSFRAKALVAMLGLVVAVSVGVLAGIELGLRRQLKDALARDLDGAAAAFAEGVAADGDRLRSEAHVVGAEPRLKAAVDTPGIDRVTLDDVAEELRSAVGWDLLVLVGADGTVVAARGAPVTLALPDAAGGALAGDPASSYWRPGAAAAVYQLAAVPLTFGPRVIGALLAGNALSDVWAARVARRGAFSVTLRADGRLAATSFAAASASRGAVEAVPVPAPAELVLAGERFVGREVALATPGPSALLLRSEDEAFAPYRTLRGIVFGVTGIAFLLAMAAAVFVSRGLSAPVMALATRADALARRQGVLTEELRHARDFQRSILPAPPEVPGATVEIVYRALDHVGGNLYDVDVPAGGEQLVVLVADATGHGVAASLTTMLIKAQYDIVKRDAGGPAVLLRALNERLVRDYRHLEVRFTAACAALDLRTGSLRFATGAHTAPCILRAGEVLEVEGGGPFVGLLPGTEYPEHTIALAPGDAFFLYTDGLTEEWSPTGDIFGEQRLFAALRHAHRGGEPAGAAACARLDAFVGPGASLQDDITIVGVRWRGPDDRARTT